jgi:membrane protein
MAGGVKRRIEAMRDRWPLFDHVMATVEHYGRVDGTLLAGAVTYFGFLSFFPLLAIAFSVVGFVSGAYPDARDSLITAIEQLFPSVVSANGADNTISLNQIEDVKAVAGLIGFATVIYTGLGWLSGLRNALESAFDVPRQKQPNFVIGKAIDIGTLIVIGVILILSVSIAGVVEAAADEILDAIGLGGSSLGSPLIWSLSTVLGVVTSTLMFFVIYRLLGNPDIATTAVVQGALFAAIGFEALKVIVVNVLGGVGGTSFAPLAVAVTLVVWINYFSRLTVYGASWAMTSRAALGRAERVTHRLEATAVVEAGPIVEEADAEGRPRGLLGRFDPGSAVVGGVLGAAVAALLSRPRD